MKSKNRGFGYIETLISLAIVIALTWMIMKKQSTGQSKSAQSLETHGIQVPTSISTASPAELSKAVELEINKLNEERERKLNCATEGNCGEVNPQP